MRIVSNIINIRNSVISDFGFWISDLTVLHPSTLSTLSTLGTLGTLFAFPLSPLSLLCDIFALVGILPHRYKWNLL